MLSVGHITHLSLLEDWVVCSFSSNKEEDFDMNNILDNQYLLGINANIFFNKDNNYLKRIAIINYYKSKTIIRFHSFPPNSVLVLKFSFFVISTIEWSVHRQ